MKSITKKLSCWLATLLLGLSALNTFAQTAVPATQAEINAMVSSPSAQTLTSYLTSNGYSNGGVVAGSAKSVETIADQPGSTSKRKTRTSVVIIVYKKAGAESIYQSLASERMEITGASPTFDYHAVGENTTTNFFVSGGTVRSAPKSPVVNSVFSNNTDDEKIDDCWLDAVLGTGENCTGCYNCLKGCLTGSGLFGNKLLCCLTKCAVKCALCVISIFKFYKCFTS